MYARETPFTVLRECIRAASFQSHNLRVAEGDAAYDARTLRMRLRLSDAGFNARQIDRYMARADRPPRREAKPALPQKDWLVDAELRRWNLHQRRALELRREARILNLAYGFLRGVPYHAMEQKSYTPPPWQMKLYEPGNPNGRDDGMLRWRGRYRGDPVLALIHKHSPLATQDVEGRYVEWKGDKWRHPHLGFNKHPQQQALQAH